MSVAELAEAVKDTLQRRGVLQQLQASVRSQVFSVLLEAEDTLRPEPTDETLLVNELIREYLVFQGLRDTLSVFIPESGQPAARPFDRSYLARALRINESPHSEQVPLLYELVAQRRQQQQQQQPQPLRRDQASTQAGQLLAPRGEPRQQVATVEPSAQLPAASDKGQQLALQQPQRQQQLHPGGGADGGPA